MLLPGKIFVSFKSTMPRKRISNITDKQAENHTAGISTPPPIVQRLSARRSASQSRFAERATPTSGVRSIFSTKKQVSNAADK
jgi:hypothetical protein